MEFAHFTGTLWFILQVLLTSTQKRHALEGVLFHSEYLSITLGMKDPLDCINQGLARVVVGGESSTPLMATVTLRKSKGQCRRPRFYPLEEEMATHFNILAWEIPWTEEPGRLLGSQRVQHDLATKTTTRFITS